MRQKEDGDPHVEGEPLGGKSEQLQRQSVKRQAILITENRLDVKYLRMDFIFGLTQLIPNVLSLQMLMSMRRNLSISPSAKGCGL